MLPAMDGFPQWMPPKTFWASSAEGFLREVVFPELEFDKDFALDTVLKEKGPQGSKRPGAGQR